MDFDSTDGFAGSFVQKRNISAYSMGVRGYTRVLCILAHISLGMRD